MSALVVMLAGLPASGKTTTAARLHTALGGALIRSCDVFRDLGIDLPAWARRTDGFTRRVADYDRVRDAAYVEMRDRLATALGRGARVVVVDAVHGEADKRCAVYEVSVAHGAAVVMVWCHCDDMREVRRRITARRGREAEPEHEASDVAVWDDIARRWCDPWTELVTGSLAAVVRYDTHAGIVAIRGGERRRGVEEVHDALVG